MTYHTYKYFAKHACKFFIYITSRTVQEKIFEYELQPRFCLHEFYSVYTQPKTRKLQQACFALIGARQHSVADSDSCIAL